MKRLSRQQAVEFVVEHWPPIIIALFILILHRDMILGDIPASGDHMIHLFRGWLMAEHMLPSGRINGWSHWAFAGYPAGVYYPILGDLLVALFRYVTLGLLSWERTYTLVFLCLLIAMPIAVYAVTRRATGPIGAMAASVLSLGDVGGWPQGGHFSTVLWAVWPFMLGLTLTWFTILACEKALEQPIRQAPGRFLAFVIMLALTVLAHPMTVFFFGLTAPLFFVFSFVARRAALPPARTIGRMAAAAAIALALTAFWTVPWITSSTEWTFAWPNVGFGGLWYPLPLMLSKLYANELFKNFYWITLILGLAGVVIGLVSRRLWPTFLAVLLIVAFIATGLCYELGDSAIGRRVQIERMAPFMKFIWFALAGVTIDRAGALLRWGLDKTFGKRRSDGSYSPAFKAVPLVAGLVLVVGLVAAGWKDSYGKINTIGRLGGKLWDDIVSAEKWVSRQPRGTLDRVLYQPGRLCTEGAIVSDPCNEVYHRHSFASGPVRTNLPRLKFGYEATAIFKNLPLRHRWPADAFLIRRMALEPDALTRLHVRWIISLVDWPPRHDMQEVKRFGKVVVYGVASGKNPPVQLQGPGTLSVAHFSDERIAVDVSGAGPDSRLYYPVAYYYPWHAYHNGEPIDISTHGVLPKIHPVLMNVPAADGRIELRYERPLSERVSGWISLVIWVLILTAALWAIFHHRKKPVAPTPTTMTR
jgi:hypothetical protein